MGLLEPPHMMFVLVSMLLVFGPVKMTELGRALGEGPPELRGATGNRAPAPVAGATAAVSAGACRRRGALVPPTNRFRGAFGQRAGFTR